MTKPKELKVGDRVKYTGKGTNDTCIMRITKVLPDGRVLMDCTTCSASGMTHIRAGLRKLPDRKEG